MKKYEYNGIKVTAASQDEAVAKIRRIMARTSRLPRKAQASVRTVKASADKEELKGMCVSVGTMRSEDIAPKFLRVLKHYDAEAYDKFAKDNADLVAAAEGKNEGFWDTEECAFAMDDLFDAMNSIAPEGYSFYGDGGDYGFWNEDEVNASAKKLPRKAQASVRTVKASDDMETMSDGYYGDLAEEIQKIAAGSEGKFDVNGIPATIVYDAYEEDEVWGNDIHWGSVIVGFSVNATDELSKKFGDYSTLGKYNNKNFGTNATVYNVDKLDWQDNRVGAEFTIIVGNYKEAPVAKAAKEIVDFVKSAARELLGESKATASARRVTAGSENFYGISGLKFVSHGSWADPEVEYKGFPVNYYDIETPMYNDWKNAIEGTNVSEDDDDAFVQYVKDHADDAISYAEDAIGNRLREEVEYDIVFSEFSGAPEDDDSAAEKKFVKEVKNKINELFGKHKQASPKINVYVNSGEVEVIGTDYLDFVLAMLKGIKDGEDEGKWYVDHLTFKNGFVDDKWYRVQDALGYEYVNGGSVTASARRVTAGEKAARDIGCTIRWNDDGSEEDVIIRVDPEYDSEKLPKDDDKIFFYCKSEKDFSKLMEEGNGEDFVIVTRDGKEDPKKAKFCKASANVGGISDKALEYQLRQYKGKLPQLAKNKYCKNCGCQLFKEPEGNTEEGYPYVCLECDENMHEFEVVTGVGKAPKKAKSCKAASEQHKAKASSESNLDDDLYEEYGNEYLRAHCPDDCIYRMGELDEIVGEVRPSEAIRLVFHGYHDHNGEHNESFNPNADYFYFNGYANLVSLDDYGYVDRLRLCIDEDSFKEWLVEQGYLEEEETSEE